LSAQMDPVFLNKEKIASLLSMNECISVMEEMFCSLSKGERLQPLRSMMWLPDKSGLLGMMPGYSIKDGVMGIKLISVFHANSQSGHPSHQGVVILFDAKHGQPLMMFDAGEITGIRTAAASAVATKYLARSDAEVLGIIGSGEQAERHVESMMLVRKIKQINVWSRNELNALRLAEKMMNRHRVFLNVKKNASDAVQDADIVCTVTSSQEPVVLADWIQPGTHVNAVGSSTPKARELDTALITKSKLFTDCFESIFNEAGDFLIPKKEGVIGNDHVRAELGDVILGMKKGRENRDEITVFKSLGIAAEDISSCWQIYKKINQKV